jgi:hypothetical protein
VYVVVVAGVTVMAELVPPVDQANIPPPAEGVAVNVAGEPLHTVAELLATVGDGFTVTTTGVDVPPQLPVTEYVPEVVTVILCVVAPVLQVFPVAKLDVSVTLPPAQKVSGPLAVITGGAEPTPTVTTSVTVQWVPVTVTVKVVGLLISAVGFAMLGFETDEAGAQLYPTTTGGASVVLKRMFGRLLLDVGAGVLPQTVDMSAT